MVNISKIGDSAVKFVFTDSDHYLYGNGEIEVPVNSLLLVIDESDMVTFKKLSGDPFLSFRADNSNLGTKAAIEQFYKDNMVGSTGGGGSESGVTSGDVETMIDTALDDYYDKNEVDAGFDSVNAALSGKASVSDVTAVSNDVSTLSGQVATKLAISDFNTYSATTDARIAEDEEVTAAALNNLDETKQDALQYYEENTEDGWAEMRTATDDGEGNTSDQHISIGGGATEIGNYQEYNDGQGNTGFTSTNIQFSNPEINMYAESEDNGETEATYFNITPTSVTINDEAVATELYVDAAISGKADTSAVTAAIDAAISGKVDTSAITTAITSGSTDSEIPTAKATYDAIQAGGGITVDSAFSRTSENPVQNKVISNSATNGNGNVSNTGGRYKWEFYSVGGVSTNQGFYLDTINGETVVKKYSTTTRNLNLVETTAITSAMTSSSTDAQVPSAKAVYDTLGGLKFVKLTQSEYDQLATKDNDTLYIISNVVS